MTRRETLIEKLVLARHLSVRERGELDPSTVERAEIVRVISRVLDESDSFPPGVSPWEKGELVYEGHFLQRLKDQSLRLWWQRSRPIQPRLLGQQIYKDFPDRNGAIEEFIRREWGSGEIDGVFLTR